MQLLDQPEDLPRLRRITKARFRWLRPEDCEDIAQDAALKLEERFQKQGEGSRSELRKPAYWWCVVHSCGIDFISRKGRYIPGDQEDVPDAGPKSDQSEATSEIAGETSGGQPDGTGPGGENLPPKPPGKTPLCVIEERLRSIYARGHSQHVELLVYGYSKLLGYKPRRIVNELGPGTLTELAEEFVARYAEESRIPRTHLDELFRDILAVKDRPEKDTLLQDHWNEETRIREWIIEVRDADPGSSTGRVDLPPNRRVAYLFAEHLELSPAQILETYRDCTLTEMAEVFRREYGERHKASPSEVDVRFGSMLDCGAGAKRTLGAYCAPEHRCTHWTHSVQRRADSEIHQSVRLGLETIFQEETQPEISMTFIRSTLLRNPVAALARQLHLETQKWKELLQFELQHFVTIPMPKGHTVDGWLRPLADQIRLSCRSGTPIRASLDTRANESEEQTLARWRTQVLGKVKPQFGCHCPETVIFAKLFGLL